MGIKLNSILKSNINKTSVNKDEFIEIIKDILENTEYQKLDYYYQHLNVSRLQHSLNVAYYSYILAKKLKLDYFSATRGAMLHDFFLYNWQEKETAQEHAFNHPKKALINAKQHFEINPIMEDCILNHMWPLSENAPKTKEGYIIQLADKYSATAEVSIQIYEIIKNKTITLLKSSK